MDANAPVSQGKPAVAAGSYVSTANASYTWKNVSAGSHNFSVELVNNDHTPLSHPVIDKVAVFVNVSSRSTA